MQKTCQKYSQKVNLYALASYLRLTMTYVYTTYVTFIQRFEKIYAFWPIWSTHLLNPQGELQDSSVRIIPGSGTLVSLCHGGIFVLVQRRWRTSAGKSWWFAWKRHAKVGTFRKSKCLLICEGGNIYMCVYIYIYIYIYLNVVVLMLWMFISKYSMSI